MFADDTFVFCPSAHGLQSILGVCWAYAELHRIIFNCSKIVCMTFKAKSAECSYPITDTGWSKRKSC